ncbi:MAG: glycosyltransferase family 4 protein [bacterium]
MFLEKYMGYFIKGRRDKTIYIFNSHIIPPKTGGERFDYEIGRYLAKVGYSVRFIEAIDSFRFRGRGFTEPFSLIFNLGGVVNKSVMIFDEVSHKRMNLFCLYIRLFTNAKLFTIVHQPTNLFVDGKVKRFLDKFSEWFFFHLMHKIVVNSKYTEKLVSSLVVNKSIKLIYPACNLSRNGSRRRDVGRKLNILYVGYLYKCKGFDILIRALGEIKNQTIDWQLTIVGNTDFHNNYAKKCIDLINRFGISDRVNFLGWVYGDSLKEIYKSADIFVLPSILEGYGMAIKEAASYGLPIISTNVGGITEIVEDGKSALLVDPGDVDGLREALVKLISDKKLRNKLGESALKTVDFTYSWDSVGKMFEEFMNEGFSTSIK